MATAGIRASAEVRSHGVVREVTMDSAAMSVHAQDQRPQQALELLQAMHSHGIFLD